MIPNPILYESHLHTPLCKHATGEPEAYAAVAEQRGLKGIIITCHNPMPVEDNWSPEVRMSLAEFDSYVAMVERAREAWAGRVDVRLGLESDYVPGMEGWLEKLHNMAEFHYILGSVHTPLKDYRDRYYRGDMLAYQQTHFEHLAMAAETGLFDCLAHPDLIKIVAPSQWNFERVLDDIRRCLDRVAATGVAMELNTSGLQKPLAEMHPSLPFLHEMRARDIPVVIGADAHKPERVAANYEEALDLLREAGYRQVSLFLHRQRYEVEIETARRSLFFKA